MVTAKDVLAISVPIAVVVLIWYLFRPTAPSPPPPPGEVSAEIVSMEVKT